jgi:putative endonuclease
MAGRFQRGDEPRWFAYMMASDSGTLYTGFASDLGRRVQQHKSGEIDGFSSKYHCTRLVWYQSFDEVSRAIAREKQIKGWTRAKKIALIESMNPRWQDLAENLGSEMLMPGESIAEHEEKERKKIRFGRNNTVRNK